MSIAGYFSSADEVPPQAQGELIFPLSAGEGVGEEGEYSDEYKGEVRETMFFHFKRRYPAKTQTVLIETAHVWSIKNQLY